MKNKLIILPTLLLLLSLPLFAKDTLLNLEFASALQQGYDQGILDKNIKFKLAGQSHKPVKKLFAEYKTNKKTRGMGKSDADSCSWALLGALKTLQSRAMSLGANAVVDIKSNYKSREFVSSTEYQCGVGFLMSGVALKANVVSL